MEVSCRDEHETVDPFQPVEMIDNNGCDDLTITKSVEPYLNLCAQEA